MTTVPVVKFAMSFVLKEGSAEDVSCSYYVSYAHPEVQLVRGDGVKNEGIVVRDKVNTQTMKFYPSKSRGRDESASSSG